MEPDRPMALLGGLSAAAFMRRHWQKRPLLIRATGLGELDGFGRSSLFELAARDDVESRLVVREGERWSVRSGPFGRRALPPLARRDWTLLAQGIDLHDDRARRLLDRFRFVGDARLDDVMVSFASDGGGVGPHVDSYDVFLLQVAGRRRWRVGRVGARAAMRADVPLKMLADFVPRHDWLLEPGDMLYLPPGWGHDGTADGPCLTASIGFRAPGAGALAADIVQRLADDATDAEAEADDGGRASSVRRYRDDGVVASDRPARIPASLARFAAAAVERLLADRSARERALGESLSEPKPGTWFARAESAARPGEAVVLDRRTRMIYDDRHVFINGDSYRAAGRDATLMRRLADQRWLEVASVAAASEAARALIDEWLQAGWCVTADSLPEEETK